jgi:putative ABC transport system permease protein
MSFFRIIISNIFHRPLNAFLSVLLFALGIGLVAFLLLLNKQLEEKFDKNLANIDLVVGAKGSPLQLILCAMYHIDAPTGNIKLSEAKPFLNPQHPLFAAAVPLSLGDSYQGYRIVGTNDAFFNLYEAKIVNGKRCDSSLTVTLGANVAAALKLNVGDRFQSNHGLVNDGLGHEHEQFLTIVGILAPTGAVIDQLIVTPTESIWAIHEEHEHKEEHHEHEHEGVHEHEDDDKMLTALLIKYRHRNNFQTLNLGRNINENTGMQAANPAIELNRLYSLMGTGERTLRLLALAIVVVSGISIFIALFNSLKERKYELSLMRAMGATQKKLFALVLSEAMILALAGAFLGFLISHLAFYWLSLQVQSDYRYTFDMLRILPEEGFLLLASLLIGLLAGVIPAIYAYKTDIAAVLKK